MNEKARARLRGKKLEEGKKNKKKKKKKKNREKQAKQPNPLPLVPGSMNEETNNATKNSPP
jgi:hypothetical protein